MKKNIVSILSLLAIVGLGWSAFEMSMQPLWGNIPLWFGLSLWVLAYLWIRPRSRQGQDAFKTFREICFFGFAATLSFPPYNLFPLGFVAWLPVLAWLDRHQQGKMSTGQLLGNGYWAFLLWNIAATYWIANTSFIPGLAAFALNALFMLPVLWLTAFIRGRLHPYWRLWVLPVAWISFEWLHHHWELSWPWLTLGNSMADHIALIQWYSWTGIFAGSLWLFVINNLVYRYLRAPAGKRVGIMRSLGLVVGIPVLVSLVIFLGYKEQGEPVHVAIVQPNFEPHYEKYGQDRVSTSEQLVRFERLSKGILQPETDYLVYPETSFNIRDVDSIANAPQIARFRAMLSAHPDVTLVSGIEGLRFHSSADRHKREVRSYAANGGDTIYYSVLNAAIDMTHSKEREIGLYLKSKLVPGPEIFPYAKVLFFLKPLIDMLDGTLSHFAMQPERTTLGTEAHPVAPVICYESVFGEYTGGYVDAGAQAIFIMTNDGWWDRTPGHQQHMAFARLRAIEHRKSIARAANTGISCFIDQHGRVSKATRYGDTAAIEGAILFNEVKTLYQRVGDVTARVSALMLLLFFAGSFFRKKKQ